MISRGDFSVLAAQTHFDPKFLQNPGPPKTTFFQARSGQLPDFSVLAAQTHFDPN